MISNVNQSAGSVRQRGTKWQATATVGEGRGAHKTTRSFKTKKEANAWLASMKATGVPVGDAAKMTVAAAFDAYVDAKVLAPNTVQAIVSAKGHAITQGIGAMKLAAVKPSHVATFTAWLSRQGLAPSTVNLYAGRLVAVLRFAAADGAMTFIPKVSKVKVANEKQQAITPADVKALYEASPENFAPAILLGAYVGLRASEAAAITVADVNFIAGTITVNKAVDFRGRFVPTKTPRSMRTIPVPPEVLGQLADACKGRTPDTMVAVNAIGRVIMTGSFSSTFAKVAADAGVDVTFHALRKFYATTMLASGVNPVAVAKYLGDTVQQMLATYALERSTDADEARQAIAAAFQATVAA